MHRFYKSASNMLELCSFQNYAHFVRKCDYLYTGFGPQKQIFFVLFQISANFGSFIPHRIQKVQSFQVMIMGAP